MSKLVPISDNMNLASKLSAFPYQTEAFLTIKDLEYSAVFHEQGLGKTKIAIDLLLYWLSKRSIDTILIVTKKQLIKNWIEEIQIHSYIKPVVLSNDKKANYNIFNSPVRIIITNFETISGEKRRMELFLKTRDVGIIIDESTKLKNPDAKITKDFFDLSELFKIRCIMTGTPVANRPYDLWAQIFFLDHGESLGIDFESFKRNTDLTNKLADDIKARRDFEECTAAIFDKIRNFTVRETKKSAGIRLPHKQYFNINCEFEDRQKQMYFKVINELSIEVQKNGSVLFDDDTVALKRLLRLTEIASNPRLIDDSYQNESAKEQKLSVLLQEIADRNEKVIVWSSYIENINYFAKKYSEYHPRKIHGSMAIADRNRSVDVFKTDEKCRVLFATPQSAKEGLTLTIANNVIFYDRGFNLDDYLQAQDRIHRISQTKDCNIYNLIIKDSIDVWIDRLLDAKQYAAFLAQGDINVDQYKSLADYSYGELIQEILQEGKNYE